MKDGFLKVAAATPDIRVADVVYNTEKICGLIDEAVEAPRLWYFQSFA